MTADTYLSAVHEAHLRLGFKSGNCGCCYPAVTAWHDDARAGRLRAAIVGGIPIDTHQGPGAELSGISAIQRADALAGGSSDGGSPETERAIAQATPGPTASGQPDLPVEVGREGTPRSSVSHLDRGAELATQPA